MLDSYSGWASKEEAIKNIKQNRQKLHDWYFEEDKKYNRALAYFDEWYEEYSGDTWEENHEAD
tara:strand:+ start:418 stop:606 length:189 start_codon:yes stop_codon:yes gene_type:complete